MTITSDLLFIGLLWVSSVNGGCVIPNAAGCPNNNIKFYLTTRTSIMVEISDDKSGVEAAPFINAPMKVLIHGTGGSRMDSLNMESIPRYLQESNYNILSIDFGPLVPENCYFFLTPLVPVVANCLARMLKLIYDNVSFITPSKTHIIGFSFGGQVAGITANKLLPLKVARITGLDPRALGFERPFVVPSANRLDSPDADFVDVIHTDTIILGVSSPIGHVDFYINKGNSQYNCNNFFSFSIFTEPISVISCSHRRSVEVFAESINSTIGFYGRPCTYLRPNPGLEVCPKTSDTPVVIMGEPATAGQTGTYQVITKSSPPWANGP